jgi:hypothetical protein
METELESQTGKKSPTKIYSTTLTEPTGQPVNLTVIAPQTMSAPNTCGNTMAKKNPEQDAGSSLSALATALTTCSTEERSNGGVTLTLMLPLMVWTLLTD